MRIVINGREITNPFVRILVGLLALAIFALLLLLFLPLLGITIAISLGMMMIFIAAVIAVACVSLLFSRRRKSNNLIEKKSR
jgi:hypothetical protein